MAELTINQRAAGHRRSLQSMHKKVSAMAAEWWGEDECCRSFLDELAEKIKETEYLLVIEKSDA
ncbi:hypothetical protein M2404_003851 [Rheinheimera pacifica]|uniref:hypothetical protein n=1 Tax=Rheinheimera pacifica TaxID=173990 RepID=UPI0021695BA3|nr:hypothetical protein [Rheinheimera pacifica]MCS4309479.1 hypothetical protein [Rheinheimera pacifica]